MAATTEFTTAVQTQLLEAVRIAQDAVVDGVRTTAELLDGVLPTLPTLSVLPFADALPSPTEAVNATFNIVQLAVAQQRVFADRLIAAAAPLLASTKA